MNGNPAIIAMLNVRLAEEHAAFIQYTTHAAMCKNFGYERLVAYFKKRADSELEHMNELADRILFLGGVPATIKIAPVFVGNDILEMFPNDLAAETLAVAGYTEGINLCVEHSDFGTRKLLEHILEEEDNHINEIESGMTQITKSGIENYLILQIKE